MAGATRASWSWRRMTTASLGPSAVRHDGAKKEKCKKCRSPSKQPCCTGDEGRSLGLGLQDQSPNRHKLRRPKGRGGERCGKGGRSARQVSLGKANDSEPLMTYRKANLDVAETKGARFLWDEARQKPADWSGGDRYLGGAIPRTGSCAERGNLCRDAKGDPEGGGPAEGRVPTRGTGADGFVVATKPSNAGGAKGPDLPVKDNGQPVTGGADV